MLAAREGSSEQSRGALAELCEAYWYPLFVFVRRQGYDPDDALDLTQGFFATLLEKAYLDDVRPEAGRFRSFLLASLKHFLYNEWDKVKTLKRGGHLTKLSLDSINAESRYFIEPQEEATPESVYEQHWAMTVLARTLDRLETELPAKSRSRFESLKGFLTGDSEDLTYRQVAAELGMTEGAVKVTIHRLRARYGEVLRAEIAQTVDDPESVDEEIEYLLTVLS